MSKVGSIAAAIAASDTPIDQAQHKLRTELRNPQIADKSAPGVVAWVVSVFYLLIAYLEAIFKDHEDHFHNIETDIEQLQSKIPSSQSFSSAAAAMAPIPPTKSKRCTTCHARGHAAPECRTADPAAMRKRVAWNRKKEKETGQPLPSYLYYPTPPFPPPPTGIHPTSPEAYTAFAADAQELRRRRQQSIRDKRRARRSAQPTTS
jgi:hypothetical protein